MFNKIIVNLVLCILFIFSSCYSDELQDELMAQCFAYSKKALMVNDAENAYIGSKVAIEFVNENVDVQDHIFLALYMHVIACDITERYDERDAMLNALEDAINDIHEVNFASNEVDFEYYSEYNELNTLANYCYSDNCKEKLLNISDRLFSKSNDNLVLGIHTDITSRRVFRYSLDEIHQKIKYKIEQANMFLDLVDKGMELWARINYMYNKYWNR